MDQSNEGILDTYTHDKYNRTFSMEDANDWKDGGSIPINRKQKNKKKKR